MIFIFCCFIWKRARALILWFDLRSSTFHCHLNTRPSNFYECVHSPFTKYVSIVRTAQTIAVPTEYCHNCYFFCSLLPYHIRWFRFLFHSIFSSEIYRPLIWNQLFFFFYQNHIAWNMASEQRSKTKIMVNHADFHTDDFAPSIEIVRLLSVYKFIHAHSFTFKLKSISMDFNADPFIKSTKCI